MTTPAWVLPINEPPAPTVSVIIPSHRPEFLHDALRSIEAQTVQDVQVLLNYRREWWGEKINDVMNIARGEFLCVLADDDMLAPTYLERTLEAARGGFDIVSTDIQFFGDRTDTYALPDFGINAFRHGAPIWMTALIRREWWDEMHGFDPGQILQDTEFWLRSAIAGADVAHVREYLLLARQHSENGAKLLDKETAVLLYQGKHRAFFPNVWNDPPAIGAPNDGRTFVAPVAIPARFGTLEGADRRRHGNRTFL